MPPLAVRQNNADGALELSWTALPTARAYFISGMGGNDKEEMILWTSSEVPDTGFGLIDYQTNPAVDRWLGEKVLLAPSTTRCTVPRGVFPGEGAMLRMIAYGNELNLVHPPRPADPKATWEQEWTAKIRVKSVATILPGMSGADDEPQPRNRRGDRRDTGAEQPREPSAAKPEDKSEDQKVKPMDILRGILGR